MPKIVQAAGMVIFTRSHPKSLLLLQHSNRWDLPKGHAEPGESMLQTALRETEEETGIPASEIDVDSSFDYVTQYTVRGSKRGDYAKRVTYFLGSIAEPVEIRLTEHIGYRWVAWPTDTIQAESIDPLLAAIATHFAAGSSPHEE